MTLFRSRLISRETQFALDLIVLAAAFLAAYLLRFEFCLSGLEWKNLFFQLPLVILTQFAALHFSGAHSFVWRYVGLSEMRTFLLAGVSSMVFLLLLRLFLPAALGPLRIPFSIILMDSLLAFGGVVGLRFFRRWVHENYEKTSSVSRYGQGVKEAVLLVGAGQAGLMAAKEISGRGNLGLEIKGFVDDDPRKQGLRIHGIKVVGTSADLPALVKKYRAEQVIITIARASQKQIRRIVAVCERIPVKPRIIPSYYDILDGRVQISAIRDVEIEDLLGREPVQLDEALVGRFLAGKRIMVTGAGGSIGSELVRQIARFRPALLLLVERAEFVLFDIDRQIRRLRPEISAVPLIADVGDEMRLRHIFATYRPEVVFHAAAHKHVPMMESNATEAVKNNVLASRLLGELAGEYGAEALVFISTDKAVNPASIMGASKRLAEWVLQDLNGRFPTRFVAVRFGNVLGSVGSVIPLFREQILRGGPVTVTHPDMKRYFMTIPEAAQLVLQAGAMGQGGEIFVLDMGEPVSILALAEEMITLSGFRPYEDIPIVFTGIRPGEKLFEELQYSEEFLSKTLHPQVYIGNLQSFPAEKMPEVLDRLAWLSQNGHLQELRQYLQSCIPEARLEGTRDQEVSAGPFADPSPTEPH